MDEFEQWKEQFLTITLPKILNDKIHTLTFDFNKSMTKMKDEIKYLQEQNKLLKRVLKLQLQVCEKCVKKKLPAGISYVGTDNESCICGRI